MGLLFSNPVICWPVYKATPDKSLHLPPLYVSGHSYSKYWANPDISLAFIQCRFDTSPRGEHDLFDQRSTHHRADADTHFGTGTIATANIEVHLLTSMPLAGVGYDR